VKNIQTQKKIKIKNVRTQEIFKSGKCSKWKKKFKFEKCSNLKMFKSIKCSNSKVQIWKIMVWRFQKHDRKAEENQQNPKKKKNY
jgi:hypothetical protein